MPLNLEDFPKIRRQRFVIEQFLDQAAVSFSARPYCGHNDDKHGFVIHITSARPSGSQAHLTTSETLSGTAASKALCEWLAAKKDEIAQVMKSAALHAEIQAAKELSEDAIQILTAANQ